MWKYIGLVSMLLLLLTVHADRVEVEVFDTHQERSYGKVVLEDSQYGLKIKPQLSDLPPGMHGFHIHETPNCRDHGLGAGDHFDPSRTKQHKGPYVQDSHLGDLPSLYVDASGQANQVTLAPRLKVFLTYGRALMIHEGGDNYSDSPKKLGGGGKRIGCGVIKKMKDF